METRNVVRLMAAVLFWIFLFLPMSDAVGEQRGPSQASNQRRVYIGLTEDFYRALQSESDSGNRVYGDRKSDEYLRQIAVSAKFMVETNLRLLEMQERIIDLLEKDQAKGSP